MRQLTIGPLRWTVGVFLLVLGAQMLVTPHQFVAPVYAALQPYLGAWAGLALVAGAGLLVVATARPEPRLAAAAHLLAGGMLVLLASGFAGLALSGMVVYGLLGVGTAAAPWWPHPRTAAPRPVDLLSLLIGVSFALVGLLLLAVPAQLADPAFDPFRAELPLDIAGFLLGGAALAVVQLRSVRPALVRAAHLLAGGTALIWGARVPFAAGQWTGVIFYCGFGAVIALLPWVLPRLGRLDLASLRVRLALALTAVSAVPLVVLVALVADRQETLVSAQALASQRTLAVALAQDIADVIALHRAALSSLAVRPDLRSLPADARHEQLRAFAGAYPDLFACQLTDAAGASLGRSDDRSPVPLAGDAIFETARRTGQPYLQAAMSASLGRPVIAFAAPLRDPAGEFAGIVGCAMEPARVAELLNRAEIDAADHIFLVDARGRVLADLDPTEPAAFADLAARPPVAAFLSGQPASGALRYGEPARDRLAASATVPGLGWGVIVDRSASAALAGVRAGRDAAFASLLLVIVLACLVGGFIADRLSTPLRRLAAATAGLGDAAGDAAIPAAGITEVRAIGDAMVGLQARLAARTHERDTADRRLRFLADASATLAASLDLDATLDSVARLTVPLLGDLCVIDLADPPGNFRRVAVAHAEPARADLARRLLRYPPRPDGRHGAASVLRTGQTVHHAAITEADHAATAHDPEHLRLIQSLDLCATLATALSARGQVLGVISVWRTSRGAPYQADDIELLEELARRAGIAVDHARLYEAQRVARETAERGAAQLRTVNERLIQVSLHAQDLAQSAQWERDRLRQVLDVLPEAVVLVDADRQTLIANAAAGALFGDAGLVGHGPFASEAVAPRHLDGSLYQPETLPIERAIRQGEIVRGEPMLLREAATGRDVPVLLSAAPLHDVGGVVTGAVLACQDITPLRELDQAREAFLATVSHDLKNPLTTIRGLAQAGQRRLTREGTVDPNVWMRHLDGIVGATSRVTAMVDELADVTSLQMGQPLALRRDRCDLVALVRQATDDYAARSDRHHLTVHAELPAVVGEWDAARLERVLGNLLDNALKYSPDGGTVEVSVAVEATETGRWAVLRVHDQGVGIPELHLATVFDRFRRGRNVGQIAGTGIGLAGVRQIVEQHGGTVGASSREGEGSSFTVRLPLPGDEGEPVLADDGAGREERRP